MADTGQTMPDKKEKMPTTRLKKLVVVVISVLVVLVVVVSTAWAIPEPRRIDTSNILKPTDIEAIGSEKDKAEHKSKQEEHAEEEHGAEEEHHPAWMFPGWQTIFAILAVGYFTLAVTYLPKIMAKEEH